MPLARWASAGLPHADMVTLAPAGHCSQSHPSFMQILATHGVNGFFKGLSTPLVTVAAFNAVLFAARGSMERLLAHSDGT